MNFQSLRPISVAYFIFLALCIPLAIPESDISQVFCAGAVLFFSRYLRVRSSSWETKASQAGSAQRLVLAWSSSPFSKSCPRPADTGKSSLHRRAALSLDDPLVVSPWP